MAPGKKIDDYGTRSDQARDHVLRFTVDMSHQTLRRIHYSIKSLTEGI